MQGLFMELCSDKQHVVSIELVLRDGKVGGGGALADAAGGVIVGSVAGAEEAAKVAGADDGDAAKVCADAHADEPLVSLDAFLIRLGVPELGSGNRAGRLYLLLSSVQAEHWRATPLECGALARRNLREIGFSDTAGLHIAARRPELYKTIHEHPPTGDTNTSGHPHDHVVPGSLCRVEPVEGFSTLLV